MRVLASLFLVSIISLPVVGQGFFSSTFYSPKEYNSHQQIWEIKQDSNQFIYFGTGQGIASFNGHNWIQGHIGEYGRGTAFHLSKNGKFYTSGQLDFGYINPDSTNMFNYTSLAQNFYDDPDSIQQHITIIEKDRKMYFYGSKGLEILENENLKFYPLEDINSSIGFQYNESLYFASQKGLFEFVNDEFVFLEESDRFNNDKISFALYDSSLKTSSFDSLFINIKGLRQS